MTDEWLAYVRKGSEEFREEQKHRLAEVKNRKWGNSPPSIPSLLFLSNTLES